jgi:hypothetical protein
MYSLDFIFFSSGYSGRGRPFSLTRINWAI